MTGCSSTDEPIAVGTLERDRIELTATFSEPITDHYFDEGDHVPAEALITQQSDARMGTQLDGARAERDRLTARLAELMRGPRQEMIREGVARLDRARAVQHDAELELARIANLSDKGFASVAQVDQLKAQRDSAIASVAESQASLDSMLAGTTTEELDQARHALAAAAAQVTQIDANIARLAHHAPTDSLVESLPYEVGEIPPIGAPVAVLLRDGAPYARVYVPEALRATVQPGDRVQVQVDGIEHAFTGTVRYISAEASFTPYFALTRYDRGRLVYVGEIDLLEADDLPAGVPLEARFNRD